MFRCFFLQSCIILINPLLRPNLWLLLVHFLCWMSTNSTKKTCLILFRWFLRYPYLGTSQDHLFARFERDAAADASGSQRGSERWLYHPHGADGFRGKGFSAVVVRWLCPVFGKWENIELHSELAVFSECPLKGGDETIVILGYLLRLEMKWIQ